MDFASRDMVFLFRKLPIRIETSGFTIPICKGGLRRFMLIHFETMYFNVFQCGGIRPMHPVGSNACHGLLATELLELAKLSHIGTESYTWM